MTRAFGNNNNISSSSNNNNNNINGIQGNKIIGSMQNSGVSQQQPQQPPMERLLMRQHLMWILNQNYGGYLPSIVSMEMQKEVEHLRCHHWLQLMRDVELLGSGTASRTPAASFRVIYSAESRGQTGSKWENEL